MIRDADLKRGAKAGAQSQDAALERAEKKAGILPEPSSSPKREVLGDFLGPSSQRAPGWVIAEDSLRRQVANRTAQLVACDTSGGPSAVVRLQSEIRLLQSLLDAPEQFFLLPEEKK